MKITTLIANYNYGHYILDAIESARSQTFPCSILVVDDCSTDDSLAIIDNNYTLLSNQRLNEFVSLKQYQELNVLAVSKNCGPSMARNIGIDFSINNTDFYQILDADDILKPNKIEVLIKEMADPLIGVVYADYDIQKQYITTREFKKSFSLDQLKRECIIHSGSLIRAQALKTAKNELGYYDINMRVAEDWDLWLNICSKGWLVKHVPQSLTIVRDHSENSSRSVNQKIWNSCWQRIQQKQKAYGI